MTALALIIAALVPPCPTEDSANCYWNAQERGNGTGQSFLAIDTPAGELLIYNDGTWAVFD